jgi:transposase-like protein
MPRKLYTREFKIRAVALLENGKKSVSQLAKELNIPENNLYSWRIKFKENKEHAFINEPQENELTLELRRLRSENARLKEEREILKKAAAWFAKESEQSTR